MSESYWLIKGIGLNVHDIESHIDKEKTAKLIYEQMPELECLNEIIATGDYSTVNIENYLYGNVFDNLADVLCHCDDTDALTCADDGEGNAFFYYPPSMPWEHTITEPQSEREVIERIITAVQKITDMSDLEICNVIDTELYVVGYG